MCAHEKRIMSVGTHISKPLQIVFTVIHRFVYLLYYCGYFKYSKLYELSW